jgi:plastocyanin
MATTEFSRPQLGGDVPAGAGARPWRRFLLWGSVFMVASTGVSMVLTGPDPFSIGFGAIYGGAAMLLWRGGSRLQLAGTIIAVILTVLAITFVVPDLLFLAAHPVSILGADGIVATVTDTATVAILVAGVAALFERRIGWLQSSTGPRGLLLSGGLVVAALVVIGVPARLGYANESGRSGDINIQMKGTKYSTSKLESSAGVAIDISNQDPTYHTFTIDGVLDQTVPANSEARVTLRLKPGTYHYYCAVPGHAETMHGTLTVR